MREAAYCQELNLESVDVAENGQGVSTVALKDEAGHGECFFRTSRFNSSLPRNLVAQISPRYSREELTIKVLLCCRPLHFEKKLSDSRATSTVHGPTCAISLGEDLWIAAVQFESYLSPHVYNSTWNFASTSSMGDEGAR